MTKDVKVAFKVKDPKSNKTVITNKGQILEDADENGNPIDDIDSTPVLLTISTGYK